MARITPWPCTTEPVNSLVAERLDRIETRVLEHLHDVEEIDVRVVTPTAQLATELHPGSTVVDLTP